MKFLGVCGKKEQHVDLDELRAVAGEAPLEPEKGYDVSHAVALLDDG